MFIYGSGFSVNKCLIVCMMLISNYLNGQVAEGATESTALKAENNRLRNELDAIISGN